VDIECGLVRPEDMPKPSNAKSVKPSGASGTDGEADQPAGLSSALVESLTAHRSAALAATLLDTPDKGLAVVVYAMVIDILGHQQDTACKCPARRTRSTASKAQRPSSVLKKAAKLGVGAFRVCLAMSGVGALSRSRPSSLTS